MKICEEFATLQGEGKYLGVPSYFVRTTGCNLRCTWQNTDGTKTICDTPYSSHQAEAGHDFDIAKARDYLDHSNIRDVVITGGEPTMQQDLGDVVQALQDKYRITIETNGTIFHSNIEKALLSLSPKLSSSYMQDKPGMQRSHARNNQYKEASKQWMNSNNDYQFKFVANTREDIVEIATVQKELDIPNDKIFLMPQGITTEQFQEKAQWIFKNCLSRGWNYTPRMHIDVFGNKRGI